MVIISSFQSNLIRVWVVAIKWVSINAFTLRLRIPKRIICFLITTKHWLRTLIYIVCWFFRSRISWIIIGVFLACFPLSKDLGTIYTSGCECVFLIGVCKFFRGFLDLVEVPIFIEYCNLLMIIRLIRITMGFIGFVWIGYWLTSINVRLVSPMTPISS